MNGAAFLKRFSFWRKFLVLWGTVPAFFFAALKPSGIGTRAGRQQIRGKARRIFLSFFPPVARALQKHYGMTGGCTSCGASCKLLNQCPHWDESTRLCGVYEDRPTVCRLFPITPQDILDRDLVLKETPCGFTFRERETAKDIRRETSPGKLVPSAAPQYRRPE